MRRLLVITYYFPPVGGVGVQRTLKHVLYLPRWGWQPVVLAPRDPAYPVRDQSLLATLPDGLEAHRTLSLEPSRLSMLAARALRRSSDAAVPAPDEASRGGRPTALRPLLRAVASAWARLWDHVLFPDGAVAWVPSAVSTGRRIVARSGIDAIYSSSPPVSTHLVAAALRGRAGRRPWVADFRDPWVGNPFAPPRSRLRRALERRLERWIVQRADVVVLAMEELRADFVRRYPDLAAKLVHIPNGYDRLDIPAADPATHHGERFRIVYAGSLYRPRELEAFLLGVERLVGRRPDLRERLEVEFIGRANESNRAIAASFSARSRLGGVVRFRGFVPRADALAAMASADALLQLMPDEPGAGMFVGGKLLEYLAFDRPILAVMPPGEGRRLVDGLAVGRSADVEPASVADALEALMDDPPASQPADPTGRYDRANLAGELARSLDRLVAEDRAPA